MPETARWLTAEEQRAWQGFRRMSRLLESRLARELERDSGLSMQDYDVLSALTDIPHHRWRAKDLGAHLLWTPSRLSHHLDRMQRRQLVRREPCDKERGNDVVLTERGFDAIRAAAPDHVKAVRQFFVDQLTASQLAALTGVSNTILARLEAPGE